MSASTSSYRYPPCRAPSPSYSSTLRRLARFHNRRNAVQYSPAQLQTALQTIPIPRPVRVTQSDHSESFKFTPEEKELPIQVPFIVRAMSVGKKPRTNRSRQRQRDNRLVDVMSPRLPPAPPSSPILPPLASSPSHSPHLIPSPPSAFFRGANNCNSTINSNNTASSIFSFQSPAVQHIPVQYRSERSSSVPELFLGASNYEETKSETEMSPKASGLRFTFEKMIDGNEFDRMLEEEEYEISSLNPQEVKHTVEVLLEGKVQPQLNIRAPRVSSSYYSDAFSPTSPSRGLITSPPLQAMLYSHLQHLNNRFQLEEKMQQNDSKAAGPHSTQHGRRERRNAVFYSAADSQKLREELAAVIRQKHNPLFLFSSPHVYASASSPALRHAVGRHRRQAALLTQPFDTLSCMDDMSCDDVSECDEELEIDVDENIY